MRKKLDRLSVRLFVALTRAGCLPALLLALALSACASAPPAAPSPVTPTATASDGAGGAATSGVRDACILELDQACSPYVTSRGDCYDDSTRWVRLIQTGECRLGGVEWSVEASDHKGQASVWPWHHGDGYAFVRGECGPYLVTATIGGRRLRVDVDLPGPLCDGPAR